MSGSSSTTSNRLTCSPPVSLISGFARLMHILVPAGGPPLHSHHQPRGGCFAGRAPPPRGGVVSVGSPPLRNPPPPIPSPVAMVGGGRPAGPGPGRRKRGHPGH